jgi:tRNA(adenine34) deaminase
VLVAIREAAERRGGWRLAGATLYVTLEPCAMCAGALVASRVARLVYGAADPKAGFCGSLGDLVRDPRLNHRLEVTTGVLEQECSALLRRFFAGLRRAAGEASQKTAL